MTTKEKILQILPNYPTKFSALEIAEEIGAKIHHGTFYSQSPYVTKILTELCNEGVLYQWIIGVGGIHDLSDSAPRWEMWYLRRDSNLAKTLIERRELNGYRFR